MQTKHHIMAISDFKKFLQSKDNLLNTLYTSEELSYCNNRISSLAGRFSAKNAIRKILKKEIPWKEINILPSKTGQPVVNFPNIAVSIAHDAGLVASLAAINAQIGVDITANNRMEELLSRKHADQILARVLTPQEREDSKKNVQKLAQKWTGKEAVSKVLGTGFWQGVFFHEIEILNKNGKSFVKLNGNAQALAKAKNLKNWKISFEQKPEATFAFVVAT